MGWKKINFTRKPLVNITILWEKLMKCPKILDYNSWCQLSVATYWQLGYDD